MKLPSIPGATPARNFAYVAAALTLARLVSLYFAAPNLGPDETQYWYWSLTPDFGYYSKPPLIAWSIAATTAIFGDAEWAVRLSAPFYHLGASIFLFLLAQRLAGPRAGFWAGTLWLTLPGVFLSSALITTDAPLLFFQSAALFFFFRTASDARRPSDAMLLGAAIGLGMLAKYAMLYFIVGAVLALIVAPEMRRKAPLWTVAAALGVAAIIFAPNIVWNANHNFDTLSHTAANANWKGAIGNPFGLLKFIGDQFGVAGPLTIVLIGLAIASAFSARSIARPEMKALAAFTLTPLVIVAVQAFISRAHGNWAAAAYPGGVILAAIIASERRPVRRAATASAALNLAVGLPFLIAFTNFAFADAIGASAAFKRLRGWNEHGAEIAAAAEGYRSILVDDRELTGELLYYVRPRTHIVAFNSNGRVDNHYEAFDPFEPARDLPALYVTETPGAPELGGAFKEVRLLGESRAEKSPGRERTLYLYEVSGYLRAP